MVRKFIKIDKKEVLRYLGYKKTQIDKTTDRLIDESIEEILKIAQFNYIYNVFDIVSSNNKIEIKDSILTLEGKSITKHLKNSEKCAIMAATLGNEVDKRIKYYNKIDITKSVIFDACATTAVEELCDKVEEKIKAIAANEGYNITSRFSPGYGDLSIDIQSKIADVLNTLVKIGLTVTNTNILLPRKSVTAFIGFSKEVVTHSTSCDSCNLQNDCKYNKEGERNCVNRNR